MAQLKFFTAGEAASGTFSLPETLTSGTEFLLTSIILGSITPADFINLNASVRWVPATGNTLELRIRRGTAVTTSPSGTIVYTTQDEGITGVDITTAIQYTEIGVTPADTVYQLTAFNPSAATELTIVGPIHLDGSVISS